MAGGTNPTLDALDQDIKEENAAIGRQRALISWAAFNGQSTTLAEALLGTMEGTLAALLARRERARLKILEGRDQT